MFYKKKIVKRASATDVKMARESTSISNINVQLLCLLHVFFSYVINYHTSHLNVIVFYMHFFYSLLFRDASTSLVISRLESLDVYQKAVYFYCCVVNVSFVKFSDF